MNDDILSKYEADVARLRARVAELEEAAKAAEKETARLKALLDRDQTGLAGALAHCGSVARGYRWLASGEWGSYDYTQQTEATLRTEIGWCLDEIAKIVSTSLGESGDRALAAFVSDKDKLGVALARVAELEANEEKRAENEGRRETPAAKELLRRHGIGWPVRLAQQEGDWDPEDVRLLTEHGAWISGSHVWIRYYRREIPELLARMAELETSLAEAETARDWKIAERVELQSALRQTARAIVDLGWADHVGDINAALAEVDRLLPGWRSEEKP